MSSTPPPLIPGYESPTPPDASGNLNFWRQLAKASWALPIVGVFLSGAIRSVTTENRTVAVSAAVILVVALLAGSALAGLSLFAARRLRNYGVLASGIAGVLANGILIAIIV